MRYEFWKAHVFHQHHSKYVGTRVKFAVWTPGEAAVGQSKTRLWVRVTQQHQRCTERWVQMIRDHGYPMVTTTQTVRKADVNYDSQMTVNDNSLQPCGMNFHIQYKC